MSPIAGTRIGPYSVLDLLGKGGMGEVYRARDAKLNRDVALKVLPESVMHDAGRAARFRREAQVLAALNHGNIGAIYGLEDVDGLAVLVLELVEGPTLADRIAQGRLPLEEALPIAKQMAAALEAAHEQGIVHRDLKPSNIKVRPDGTVKVLDFGLAKATDASAAPDVPLDETHSVVELSRPGAVMGTARYMSPEQAAGKPVDKRSDIWSFGVVLFEMLTGDKAFKGESTAHAIAAVLREEPAWASLPPDTPAAIRRLLRRCLEKDRKRRLDSAAAVILDLDDAQSAAVEAPSASRQRSLGPTAVAAIIAGASVASIGTWMWMRSTPPAAAARATFTIAPPATLPWRASPQAAARDFAVAPDGTFMVYRSGDLGQLVVRWFDRLDAEPLADVSSAVMPFVSPDSRWIGFVQDDLTLKKVAATGGAPVTLTRLPVWPRGATWLDDATIIIGSNSSTTGLLRVSAGGGDPTVLTTPDRAAGEEGHLLPYGLPGGGAVLFTIGAAQPENARIAVLDLKSGLQTTLLRGGRDAQFVASGHLIFLAGLGLSAVRFDVATRTLAGEPVRVIDGVALSPTSALNVATTAAGTLVFLPTGAGSPEQRSLVWVDRRGAETATGAPGRAYESVRLSPDGTRAVVSIRDQQNDLWLWDFSRKTLTRLTFDADIDIAPVWTPDSRRVVYASARTGVYNLYARDVSGTGADVRLTAGANTQLPSSVTPDGGFVLAQEVRPQTGADLVRVALAQGASPDAQVVEGLVETPFNEWGAEVSPDGRFVAYLSRESGRTEVYVRPFQRESTERWQVSSEGANEEANDPAWTRGGRELIYKDDAGRLIAVPVDTSGSELRTGTPSSLGWSIDFSGPAWRAFDVAPNGTRFLVLKRLATSAPAQPSAAFVVVQHWAEELKRLVLPR